MLLQQHTDAKKQIISSDRSLLGARCKTIGLFESRDRLCGKYVYMIIHKFDWRLGVKGEKLVYWESGIRNWVHPCTIFFSFHYFCSILYDTLLCNFSHKKSNPEEEIIDT